MAPARFSLHRFEYLRASTESTLLRLVGRWAGDAPAPDDPTLVVSTPARTLRVTPLPQPASVAENWIVAYSVPLMLVRDVDARFELELAESVGMPLPHPRERTIGALREESNAAPVRALRAPVTPPSPSGPREESRRAEHVWAVLREQIATSLAERAGLVERIEREAEARAALAEEVARQRFEADVRRRAEEEARRDKADAQQALAEAQAELARAQREARDQLSLERRVIELEADVAEAERVAEAAREAERDAQHEYEAARGEVDALARTAEDRLIALKKASRRISDLRDQANSAARASREQSARQLEELWATLNVERARSSELESSWRESAEEVEALRERVAALEAVNGQLLAGVEDGERRLDQVGELAATFRESLAAVRPEGPRFTRETSMLRRELDERVQRLAELEGEAERLRSAVHAHAGVS